MTDILDRDTLGTIATDAAAAMFSLQLQVVDDINAAALTDGRGHAVLLRLHGIPALFLMLACDQEAGAQIASVVFEVDPAQADNTMIDDALRELANIFAGQVKSFVAPEHQIGLPRVQQDSSAFAGHPWSGVRLRIGDGEQMLDLAIAA